MTDTTAAWLRQFASPRTAGWLGSPGRRATALLLRLACVALLGWIGYIHLHLWLEGYRQIPTDGPMFLLDAVAGYVLAAALLVWPAPLAGLASAGYTAATLGALLISLTVGLFGFHESISASYVVLSLVVETVTTLALLTWTFLVAAVPGQSPAKPYGTARAAGMHAITAPDSVRAGASPGAKWRASSSSSSSAGSGAEK